MKTWIKSTRPSRQPGGVRAASRPTARALSGAPLTDSKPVHRRLELSSVPQQQQLEDGLSPFLTGIWVTGVSATLGKQRLGSSGLPSPSLYHCLSLFFLLSCSHLSHQAYLSENVIIFSVYFHFSCIKTPKSFFPLFIFSSHPLKHIPSPFSHTYRPFSHCLQSPFDPPVLLNHLSSFLPLIFLSSSFSSASPPLHVFLSLLPRIRIIYIRLRSRRVKAKH